MPKKGAKNGACANYVTVPGFHGFEDAQSGWVARQKLTDASCRKVWLGKKKEGWVSIVNKVGFSCFQDDEVVRVVYGCSGKTDGKGRRQVLCYNGVASLSAFFCSAAWCNPLRSRKSVPPPASRPLRTRVGRCGEQNGGSLTYFMRHARRSFLGFHSLATPFLIQTCTYMYFWTLT